MPYYLTIKPADIASMFIFLLGFIVFLFAVVIHEASHAWVAYYFGDPTAKYSGRLTLNPFAHIDLFGTIFLPIILLLNNLPAFGYAKPVPVNPSNFRHPRNHSALVALAGPGANFFAAIITAIPLKYFIMHGFDYGLGYQLLDLFFNTNTVLLALNILPFPPLDGSKIIGLFVPDRWHYEYEIFLHEGLKYFMIFFFFDFFLGRSIYGFSIFSFFIGSISEWIRISIGLGT